MHHGDVNRLLADLKRHGHDADYAIAAQVLRIALGNAEDIPTNTAINLAVDAMDQWPRPFWLLEIAGPHPHPPRYGELTNWGDVASTSEWGQGNYGQAA